MEVGGVGREKKRGVERKSNEEGGGRGGQKNWRTSPIMFASTAEEGMSPMSFFENGMKSEKGSGICFR